LVVYFFTEINKTIVMIVSDARYTCKIKCRIAIEREMERTSRRGRSREQLPDYVKKGDDVGNLTWSSSLH
jgi:hypothetical protein